MHVAIRDFTILWIGYKEVITGVKDLGLKSFELAVEKDLKPAPYKDMGETVSIGFDVSTEKKRRELTRRLESENVEICALLVSQDFAKEDVKAEIKWVVDACKAASSLGVSAVRIDCPRHKPGVTMEEYAKLTAKCIREILEITKDLDVPLAMENHGVIGNNREFIQEVLNTVKSERMGLTIDTGNFYWYGYPLDEVYDIIESFAPYAKHTHLKNLKFSEERQKVMRKPGEDWPKSAATLYEGDVDHKRLINILRKAGYDRDITVEDESLGPFPLERRVEIIRKDIEYLKRFV